MGRSIGARLSEVLNHNELRKLAQQAGVGEKTAGRILGSVKVGAKIPSPNAQTLDAGSPSETTFELGFALAPGEKLLKAQKDELKRALISALKEYGQTAPVVFAWLGRGDFNPNKIPEQVTYARLVHACRSVGRIKAKLMRQLNAESAASDQTSFSEE